MAKTISFHVGEKVRVKTGKKTIGDTLWEITRVQSAARVTDVWIKEAGTDYAEQRFDTSLLVHAKD